MLLVCILGVVSGIENSEFRIENGEALAEGNSEFGVEELRRGVLQQGADTVDFVPGSTFFLEPNYPNPFLTNQSTTIAFSLDRDATVSLTIYDCFYNEIEVLIDEEERIEGRHLYTYTPGLRIASGMYFYTLQIKGGDRLTQRMLYIR